MTKTLTRSELHKMADDFIYLSGRPANTSDVKDFADKLISAGVLVLEPEPQPTAGEKFAEGFIDSGINTIVLRHGGSSISILRTENGRAADSDLKFARKLLSSAFDDALASVERGRVDWEKVRDGLQERVVNFRAASPDRASSEIATDKAIGEFFSEMVKESIAPAKPAVDMTAWGERLIEHLAKRGSSGIFHGDVRWFIENNPCVGVDMAGVRDKLVKGIQDLAVRSIWSNERREGFYEGRSAALVVVGEVFAEGKA